MNYRVIFQVLGFILFALGLALLPPVVIAFLDETFDLFALAISAGICLGVGGALLFAMRGEAELRLREGFAIVTFGWLAAGLAGALPFWISGVCANPVDAFFESVSGFTTTGATVLVGLDSMPHGILLWRSLTQWLGGLGIVLLTVAVLPMLGVGGMQLFNAEVPGPTTDKLSPRIRSTAKILWGVYVGLTAAEAILLIVGGMGPFEAFCHSFATVSTGGFSTRDASVLAFDSVYIEVVITAFMFVGGANFALHYWCLRGQWRRYWKNEEFRLYTFITVAASAALAIAVQTQVGQPLFQSIRIATFQAVSVITTTGFMSSDYLLWGFASQMILFVLFFSGGSSGSTAGGLKIMRVGLIAKHFWRGLKRVLHPRAVYTIRQSGAIVTDDVMMSVLGFFIAYLGVFVASAVLLTAMGVDLLTSMSAAACALGNVGPGLNEVGPATNYGGLPLAAKLLLSLCMMLGRLEIFTMLIVATPMFWRKV